MRQRIGPWALALLATACGSGGSPSAPSTTATPATVMTVVSGETEQPVAGAVVQASGQRYVTDAGGRFTLGAITNRNVLIEAPGFLRRDAFLFDGHGPRLSLWPVDPARGLSEDYIRQIVYGQAASLGRLAPTVTRVVIVPSEEYLNDPLGLAAHEHAAERLTAAMEGRITFTVAPTPGNDGAAIVTSSLDEQACGPTIYRGCATGHPGSGGYIGGSIWMRPDVLREGWYTILLHEMGHVLGLGHNDDNSFEVMSGNGLRFSVRDFSAREKATLHMMYQRRWANQPPDRDSDVRTTSSARVTARPVYCSLGG